MILSEERRANLYNNMSSQREQELTRALDAFEAIEISRPWKELITQYRFAAQKILCFRLSVTEVVIHHLIQQDIASTGKDPKVYSPSGNVPITPLHVGILRTLFNVDVNPKTKFNFVLFQRNMIQKDPVFAKRLENTSK